MNYTGEARKRNIIPATVSSSDKDAGKRIKDLVQCTWQELPTWQQDNEFIHSGYRSVSRSFIGSLKSLGSIHNETVNIYSHLFGAVLFATMPFFVYTEMYPRYATATRMDIFVFSTFFFGVALCFLLSATFHIINNHSPGVAAFGNQLDYLGVVILMWGSTIPTIYYGFYCDADLQRLYWAMISLLALACVGATFNPNFRHRTFRPFRAAMYSGLGLSAIVFILHGILKHGWYIQSQRMSLNWMVLMAGFNLTGAMGYVARISERWSPRKYDIYGSSHQILHFMVIFAGLAHMIGLFKAFDVLHTQSRPCG